MSKLKTFFEKFDWKTDIRLPALGTSPEADWKIIFASTVVLSILAITLSVFIFVKVDKGEVFVVKEPTGQMEKTLNISRLKETVSHYRNKALEFGKIKSKKTSATDPSI